MGWLLLLLLAGIAAVGAALPALVWWYDPPPDVAGPLCARCGYCVRALPTFTCPECGSDLRTVGAVPAPTAQEQAGRAVVWLQVALALVGVIMIVILPA